MRPIKMIFLAALFTSLISCNQPSPDKTVQVAWLNANRVVAHYSPRFFGELRELKSKRNITVFKDNEVAKGTAVEYVNQLAVVPLNESIQKVKDLPEQEDTKAIKAASLAVFEYGKEIFENDYIQIATMIDGGRPAAEIDAAIENLFAKYDPEMQAKLNRLDELVIPYAEKHDIPIQKVTNQPE